MITEQCRGQSGEPVGHGLEFEIICGAQRAPGNDALLQWRAEAAERFLRQGTETMCQMSVEKTQHNFKRHIELTRKIDLRHGYRQAGDQTIESLTSVGTYHVPARPADQSEPGRMSQRFDLCEPTIECAGKQREVVDGARQQAYMRHTRDQHIRSSHARETKRRLEGERATK